MRGHTTWRQWPPGSNWPNLGGQRGNTTYEARIRSAVHIIAICEIFDMSYHRLSTVLFSIRATEPLKPVSLLLHHQQQPTSDSQTVSMRPEHSHQTPLVVTARTVIHYIHLHSMLCSYLNLVSACTPLNFNVHKHHWYITLYNQMSSLVVLLHSMNWYP